MPSRVDFKTFNYFSEESKGDILQNYDLIVVDEAHHIASKKYGKCLNKCLERYGCKTLGLTATPVRMDGINVETMFDATVHGLTNFEAIMQKMMPRIEYLTCTPEEEVEFSVKDVDWDTSFSLVKEAVKDNPKKKWICFFTKIDALNNMKPYISKLFPKKEILEIHNRNNSSQKTLDRANKLDECVMLNCDMLLEGLHFDNVDGIILFREVQSVPVFEQIIGRVSAMGKEENPIVIDCSSTWKRMDRYIEPAFDRTASGSLPVGLEFKTPCFVSLKNKQYYDYMEYLKRQYEHSISFEYKGERYESIAECCREYDLTISTFNSCRTRHPEFGIKETFDYCLLNKNNKGFEYQGKVYNSINACCRALGLSYSTIKAYSKRHQISYQKTIEYYMSRKISQRTLWTYEEKKIIKKYYPLEGTEVCKRLDGKTKAQCKSFAIRNKISFTNLPTKWSDEEREFLLANYTSMTARELAEKLGRTEAAVRYILRETKKRKMRRK